MRADRPTAADPSGGHTATRTRRTVARGGSGEIGRVASASCYNREILWMS
jgi:hypothetical protein